MDEKDVTAAQNAAKAAPEMKPVARMSVVIETDRVLDTTAQKELLDAMGTYGKVVKATHKVLRAHSTELV